MKDKIMQYFDFVLLGLALIGEVFAYLASGEDGLLFFGIHFLIFLIFAGRFLLLVLEEEERKSQSKPDQKIAKRASMDLVARSKTIAEEGQRKLSHYSSIFLHLKNLATIREEDEQLRIFMDLLNKNLGAQKITFFDVDESRKIMRSRKSTDVRLSSGDPLEIPFSEETLLGYAGLTKEGLEWDKVKQNAKLSHLSMDDPIPMQVCSPILCGSQMMGFVNIGEIKKGSLDREDQQFFSALCTLLGLSMKNAQNFLKIETDLKESEQRVVEKDELNERIKQMFGKFTSPNVVQNLIEQKSDLVLGGENKHVSLLFADIRGFTSYCERRTPADVVEALNEYLTRMSRVIIKYDGTLDKYIGDEIMAFWGAPLDQPDHAKLAVQAGYEMLLELKKLALEWEKQSKEPFSLGVGINSGDMIVGNIGSSLRMDYTVIGDSVNLAARVQGLTRKFKADYLITEHTFQNVKEIVKARKIGALQVKGKEEPTVIYAVDWVDLKPITKAA